MKIFKRASRAKDPLNIDELMRQAEEVKARLTYTELRRAIEYRNMLHKGGVQYH